MSRKPPLTTSASFRSSSSAPDNFSPPSRSSTTRTASSTHSYDSYLIPDTFELPAVSASPAPPAAATTAAPSQLQRASTWDTYLWETSRHQQDLKVDRAEIREDLLVSMKEYYGNRRWQAVDTFEEDGVEYVCTDGECQGWADQIVLYGDRRRWSRRSRYFDRKGNLVDRGEFLKKRIEEVEREGGRPALLQRLRSRLNREIDG